MISSCDHDIGSYERVWGPVSQFTVHSVQLMNDFLSPLYCHHGHVPPEQFTVNCPTVNYFTTPTNRWQKPPLPSHGSGPVPSVYGHRPEAEHFHKESGKLQR